MIFFLPLCVSPTSLEVRMNCTVTMPKPLSVELPSFPALSPHPNFFLFYGESRNLKLSPEFERFRSFNIKFKTIPLYSPHWGAVWERLIGIVNSCISKTIGHQTISYYNFITIVSDAQKIINSHPLTYCSQEHTIDAITPNHLVNPGRSAPSAIINKEHAEYAWELDEVEYRLVLLHTLECRYTLLAKFVQHWHQQYLLSLREQ